MISNAIRVLVDLQLHQLARVRFRPDPLLGSYSSLASILASAPKRHGPLIEAAINETLRNDSDYVVWTERKFLVPHAADHAVQAQQPDEIAMTRLPYGSPHRTLQIDLMAYSRSRRRLGAYEIKRANGAHDAGKLRSLRRDVFAVQTTLASYGAARRLIVDEAISRVICYYGQRSLPPPWSIINTELDRHFGCDIRPAVEAMTDYFRARIADFIEGIDDFRPELRQMVLPL